MTIKKVRKNTELYRQLEELDLINFPNCGDSEFQSNRDWWVVLNTEEEIIAYCGSLYESGICVFVRAWVHKQYRNRGLHKKMITTRVNAAYNRNSKCVVTYTMRENLASANNLIRKGFLLHNPQFAWVGRDVLYFIKHIKRKIEE
jgi:citrate lyase synthetase